MIASAPVFCSVVQTAHQRLHQLQLVRCQDRIDRVVGLLADGVHLRGESLVGECGRSGVENFLNPVVVLLGQLPHLLLLLRRKVQVLGQATDLLLDRPIRAPA